MLTKPTLALCGVAAVLLNADGGVQAYGRPVGRSARGATSAVDLMFDDFFRDPFFSTPGPYRRRASSLWDTPFASYSYDDVLRARMAQLERARGLHRRRRAALAPPQAQAADATEESRAVEKPDETQRQIETVRSSEPAIGITSFTEDDKTVSFVTPYRGLKPEDIKVHFNEESRILTVQAEGHNEQASPHSFYSSNFAYRRSYRLPNNVDVTSGSAEFAEDGGAFRISFDKVLPEPEPEPEPHNPVRKIEFSNAPPPTPQPSAKAIPRPPASTAKSPSGPIYEEGGAPEDAGADPEGPVENL